MFINRMKKINKEVLTTSKVSDIESEFLYGSFANYVTIKLKNLLCENLNREFDKKFKIKFLTIFLFLKFCDIISARFPPLR